MARTSRQLATLGVTVALALGSSSVPLSNGLGQEELGIELDGKKLFDKETFGGNGRTCLTCHRKDTGTLTLSDVRRIIDKASAIYVSDVGDEVASELIPLFNQTNLRALIDHVRSSLR